jgi:hypothetical protein
LAVAVLPAELGEINFVGLIGKAIDAVSKLDWKAKERRGALVRGGAIMIGEFTIDCTLVAGSYMLSRSISA